MKRQHKGGDNRFTQKRGKCYDQSATEKLGVQMESERGLRGRTEAGEMLAWKEAPGGPQLVLGKPGVGMALRRYLGLRQQG